MRYIVPLTASIIFILSSCTQKTEQGKTADKSIEKPAKGTQAETVVPDTTYRTNYNAPINLDSLAEFIDKNYALAPAKYKIKFGEPVKIKIGTIRNWNYDYLDETCTFEYRDTKISWYHVIRENKYIFLIMTFNRDIVYDKSILKLGLTEAQLTELYGKPDEQRTNKNEKTLIYAVKKADCEDSYEQFSFSFIKNKLYEISFQWNLD
jgi:hypothetical protein